MVGVEYALSEAEEFFAEVEEASALGERGREFRVREPELVPNSLGGRLAPLTSSDAPRDYSKNWIGMARQPLSVLCAIDTCTWGCRRGRKTYACRHAVR